MPAVHFETHPPKPHRGLTPIGRHGMPTPTHGEAVLFLGRLDRVSDHLGLVQLLCDMHRLIYLGEIFTKAGILRCLRLRVGRTQATWIEGCIDMLAAEEEAQKPEDHQL